MVIAGANDYDAAVIRLSPLMLRILRRTAFLYSDGGDRWVRTPLTLAVLAFPHHVDVSLISRSGHSSLKKR